MPDVILDKQGFKGEPGLLGFQGLKGFKGLIEMSMRLNLFNHFKLLGRPGDSGPLGYEGPAGSRGVPGDVIPVRLKNIKVSRYLIDFLRAPMDRKVILVCLETTVPEEKMVLRAWVE